MHILPAGEEADLISQHHGNVIQVLPVNLVGSPEEAEQDIADQNTAYKSYEKKTQPRSQEEIKGNIPRDESTRDAVTLFPKRRIMTKEETEQMLKNRSEREKTWTKPMLKEKLSKSMTEVEVVFKEYVLQVFRRSPYRSSVQDCGPRHKPAHR